MKMTMLDYVIQAPAVMEEILTHSTALTAPIVALLREKPYRILRLVASGSSANAAWCARPMLRSLLGIEVLITPPYTFVYHECDLRDDELVLVISQSGYSTNALAALDAIRAKGRQAIGLTSDLNSDMKDYCELLVNYGCSNEEVGYVTQGVSTLVLYLQLLSIEGALVLERITRSQYAKWNATLQKVIYINRLCIEKAQAFIRQEYMDLSSFQTVYLCGSGGAYGVACEGALKLCETLQIPAIAYETEEFLHGPELQLTPHHTVFFLDSSKDTKRVRELWRATQLVTRRSYLLTCTEECDDHVLALPYDGEMNVLPLCYLPFFQILSYRMTEDKHLWHKHPLCARLENTVNGKSHNYVHKEVV